MNRAAPSTLVLLHLLLLPSCGSEDAPAPAAPATRPRFFDECWLKSVESADGTEVAFTVSLRSSTRPVGLPALPLLFEVRHMTAGPDRNGPVVCSFTTNVTSADYPGNAERGANARGRFATPCPPPPPGLVVDVRATVQWPGAPLQCSTDTTVPAALGGGGQYVADQAVIARRAAAEATSGPMLATLRARIASLKRALDLPLPTADQPCPPMTPARVAITSADEVTSLSTDAPAAPELSTHLDSATMRATSRYLASYQSDLPAIHSAWEAHAPLVFVVRPTRWEPVRIIEYPGQDRRGSFTGGNAEGWVVGVDPRSGTVACAASFSSGMLDVENQFLTEHFYIRTADASRAAVARIAPWAELEPPPAR